jgi:hypothetical protein
MAKKSGTKKSVKISDLKPNKDARSRSGDSSTTPKRGTSGLNMNHNETLLRG